MKNRFESPIPENFEPLTPEEIEKLDSIVLEDQTARVKLIDAAQSGDPLAVYYMTHTKHKVVETEVNVPQDEIITVSPQKSSEVKTQPHK
jgi:hypothetical protein